MSRLNLLRLQRLTCIPVRTTFQPRYNDKMVPVTFENVVFPPNGEMKLPVMPTEPFFDPELGEEKYKTTRRMIEVRGVEPIHNTLIHKQFGLAAVSGGFLRPIDFKFLQTRINKNLMKNQFAVWRVPAPWLPRTRKPQGTKLGGGKGQLKNYVTPVRAERIILELGGYMTELEARAYVTYMTDFLPVPVRFVSEDMMAAERQQQEDIKKYNKNPWNWEKMIDYNMQNCRSWLTQYDIMWKGKYK
ncbi:unnamed protein product [Bursaphelenchus okinawaensis]|uniref:Large ribosomal subunit protein uL16m n=1 Tax=Bursaphelenchus okinawaensis TaxID=465554 RepID=A0A811KPD9_9BILA|nr:unnamed protein product [Bursaphelenchus okinawaensis]CAG9106850.1 unnamed protein product [Bursaphelenchus okinawaensis]